MTTPKDLGGRGDSKKEEFEKRRIEIEGVAGWKETGA